MLTSIRNAAMLTNDDMSSTLLRLFHLSLFMLKSAARSLWPEISKKVTRYPYSTADRYERIHERKVHRTRPIYVSHSR